MVLDEFDVFRKFRFCSNHMETSTVKLNVSEPVLELQYKEVLNLFEPLLDQQAYPIFSRCSTSVYSATGHQAGIDIHTLLWLYLRVRMANFNFK